MSTNKKVTLILPTPGDPLLLLSWYKNFLTYEHLIDECLIYVNHINRYLYTPLTDEHLKKLETFYNEKISHPKIKITIDTSCPNEHGRALSKFIKTQNCLNEVLLFMEDDNYIYNNNNLKTDLEQVKNGTYDLIGIPRHFCSGHLVDYMKKIGDEYVGFWPTSFIVSRKELLKTDLNFDCSYWEANEKIPYLSKYDHVFDKPTEGDTMVGLSLQLKELIPKDKIKNNTMLDLSLITDAGSFLCPRGSTRIFDTLYPAIEHNSIHIGSMSFFSQIYLWASDLPGKSLENVTGDLDKHVAECRDYINNSFNKYCRIAFMEIINDLLQEEDFSFKKHYHKNMVTYIQTHFFDSIIFNLPIPVVMSRGKPGITTYYETFKNIIVSAWLK